MIYFIETGEVTMGTEQEKIANRERVWSMLAVAMTKGIWDLVKDSSSSITPQIGLQILEMIEKQMGLSVAGNSPEAIIADIGTIFTERLGFAANATVEPFEKGIKLSLSDAEATDQFGQLKAGGVEKLFSHPVLCCGVAALAKIGKKSRGDAQIDMNSKSTVISFELI
jgi:hypothetical protein